jgi:hypothetical protein
MGPFQTMPATLVGFTSVALSAWTYMLYTPLQNEVGTIIMSRSRVDEAITYPVAHGEIEVHVSYRGPRKRVSTTVMGTEVHSDGELIRNINRRQETPDIPVVFFISANVPWCEVTHLMALFTSHGFDRVDFSRY